MVQIIVDIINNIIDKEFSPTLNIDFHMIPIILQ